MVGEGTETGKLDEELKVWLDALDQRVQILNRFMASKDAKW